MSSIPPIDPASLPADIRNGPAKQRQNYESALGFERMLVQQLTKSLADSAKPVDGDDASDAASTTYKSMLPDTLADAVMSAGGLGLARSLVPQEETK